MPGIVMATPEVEASCAICGAPPYPECPHEGERLEIALNQAMQKWSGFTAIRDWVTNQARNQVVKTFHEMRALQIERYHAHLQSQPYYTLYHRYNGAPPLAPSQLQQVRADMLRAEQMLKAGVDEAWRASCLKYPEIMDYYFSLVIFDLPSDRDPAVRDPTFGGGGPGAVGGREVAPSRQLKVRRDSVERDHRKKERRRSRGRTPPPQVPLAPAPYSRPR